MTDALTWDQAIATLTANGGPFEMIEREAHGRKTRAYANTPNSLREALAGARLQGDKTFLVFEDETWSFRDVMGRVDEIADVLVNRYEIQPGDRVAIAMRNYPEWIASFAAIVSIGGIAVCMNAWWKKDEMAYGLENSGAKHLIADIERIRTAEPTLTKAGISAMVVRHDGERPEGVEAMEDVLRSGASMPDVELGPDMDAMILYTSGTTGFPKGAVSTHHAVLSALQSFACRALAGAMTQPPKEPNPHDPCFILAVPLFHVTGLVPVMLSCFLNGMKLVIMYKWSPERALN